jgi:ribosomal-protein-alanine N-acetyltransferase
MLRRISSVDSQLLADIHGRCFDDGWSVRDFQEILSQDVFFGFLGSEKKIAAGFIVGKMVCDEIEIITFCVLPEFRNRGVGKTLIAEIENQARNNSVKKIFLEVSENNAPAKKIYERLGYAEISKRFAYYRTKNGDSDALVMQKNIE